MKRILTVFCLIALTLLSMTSYAQCDAEKEKNVAMTITYPFTENPVEMKDNYDYKKGETTLKAFVDPSYKIISATTICLKFTSTKVRPYPVSFDGFYQSKNETQPSTKVIFNEIIDRDFISYIEMDGTDINGTKRYIKVVIHTNNETNVAKYVTEAQYESTVKELTDRITELEKEIRNKPDSVPAPSDNQMLLWIALGLAIVAFALSIFLFVLYFKLKENLFNISGQLKAHLKGSENATTALAFDNSNNETRLSNIEKFIGNISASANNDKEDTVEKIEPVKEPEPKPMSKPEPKPYPKRTFTVDGFDGFKDSTIDDNLDYNEGIIRMTQVAENRIEFSVNEDGKVQMDNMESVQERVLNYCNVVNNFVPRISRIVNERLGIMEKNDGRWEIVEKPEVRLE